VVYLREGSLLERGWLIRERVVYLREGSLFERGWFIRERGLIRERVVY
jgi:hypothetical protein